MADNERHEKQVNRLIKDSVFTNLFSDIKYLRKLYACIYDDEANYTDEDFKLITLENTLVNGVYNDLGLLVRDKFIILVEAQSTFNPNMALRLLIYVANSYYDYVFENGINIYGSKKIEVPEPVFLMVYTGNKKLKSNVLKLSDIYRHSSDEIPLELIVKVISRNKKIQNILDEYIEFCQRYDKLSKGEDTPQGKLSALKQAILYCKEQNILKEYLENKETEVQEIMMSVFTQEQATAMMLKEERNIARQEGIEFGMERGMKQNSIIVAKNFKNKGLPLEMIVECTGLTKEEVEKL